ncbi:hypothetical protein TGDOM2_397710 [Toxoplasma gondii GAB2-2007-GAL-DOM2]|uniref:Uncharacterized protein n=1 Tax=Toxoplasma gondii GAB2-2007-GAL-DOM2 TaxID=1130820 RepID=A0A086KV85_TOXGO|nr:hypothetical protein TGDOM2_397710 [Toxoplasma gondii GAB2-2007-GAL-DOM2]
MEDRRKQIETCTAGKPARRQFLTRAWGPRVYLEKIRRGEKQLRNPHCDSKKRETTYLAFLRVPRTQNRDQSLQRNAPPDRYHESRRPPRVRKNACLEGREAPAAPAATAAGVKRAFPEEVRFMRRQKPLEKRPRWQRETYRGQAGSGDDRELLRILIQCAVA